MLQRFFLVEFFSFFKIVSGTAFVFAGAVVCFAGVGAAGFVGATVCLDAIEIFY